jgi:hypothetical protein
MSEISLDADSIVAEARARTGLEDLGDPSYEEAMRRLVDGMDREAKLHEVGRATQRERVVGLLVNRLRAEAAYARHPEIEEEQIEAPFVIAGLARTGTTMLQRTISADPRMFCMLWWEGRHPAPFEGGDEGAEARIEAAEAEVAAMVEAAPELMAAHPFDAHAPDEEIMLLEHAFYSTNSEAYVHVPSYSAWLDEQDQSPGYLYMRRILKLLQWQKRQRGEQGERWVLKSPHHLGYMKYLFDAFPDVRVVQTHRDPVQTIPSFSSLVLSIRQSGSDQVDALQVGTQWSDRMRRSMEACMGFREEHDERFLDLRYEELIADPMAGIQQIYDFIGMELTDEVKARMQQWAVENARDKRPVHTYTLEQFGFTEEGLARDFARYRERFGLD